MAAGTIRWSGTFTLPASDAGEVSSVAVALASVAATDRIVCTPSKASLQVMPDDVRGAFDVQIVKEAGVGFTAYASRGQLPVAVEFDYVILTNST